mmetsp:Transcript_12474/g.43314  ORF Transcript_12474/g.43314 Transcript_12474/m.43314 type:complete len:158 (+) Transcript_12474:132-605(+)
MACAMRAARGTAAHVGRARGGRASGRRAGVVARAGVPNPRDLPPTSDYGRDVAMMVDLVADPAFSSARLAAEKAEREAVSARNKAQAVCSLAATTGDGVAMAECALAWERAERAEECAEELHLTAYALVYEAPGYQPADPHRHHIRDVATAARPPHP